MSAYTDLVRLDRPVAYWPLQDASGASTALDLTGHGHDLAYHLYPGFSAPGPNAPQFGALGPFAGQTALQAHLGTQQSVLLAGEPDTLPDTTGPFSWEVWLYWDSTAAGPLHYSDFLGWSSGDWGYDGFNTTLRYYTLAEGGAVANTLNVGVGDFGARSDCVQTATGAPTTDAWHHVALVSDGVLCVLYVDRVALSLVTSDAAPLQDNGPTARFWLAQDVALAIGLPGRLAHVALYDVALSACQVESHYDQATTGSYTPCPEWVRLRHSSGQGYWQSKGDVTEEWAAGLKRVELPFPTMAAPPLDVLGKDPATGLPMWAVATDLVPKDTGAGPVPTGTVVQTTPGVVPTPVPAPVPDNCPFIRCGAAYQLSVKLKDQYDLIRGLLLWMLAAPFLLRLPLGEVGTGTSVIVFLLEKLLRWMMKNGVAVWAIAVITAVLGAAQIGLFRVDTSFEEIDEAGREQLQRLAYNVLTCTDNTFKLTPDMVANWGAGIDRDTTDFSEWQRHLLVYCIQFTPFQTYDQTAASGALAPSDACTGWTGP